MPTTYDSTGRVERPGVVFRTDWAPFTCKGCGITGMTMARTQVWCSAKSCQEKRRRGEIERNQKRRARGVKARVKV